MDIKKLQAVIIDALEDVKAADIVLFDTSKLTSMFDRLIIASGTSNRQTKALADSVRDKVRKAGGSVVGMEGEETGEWVLVDLGDIVVHIMQPPIRAYYQLEEIWGGKQIDLEKAKAVLKPKAVKSKTKTTSKTASTAKKQTATTQKESKASTSKPKTTRKTLAASKKSEITEKKADEITSTVKRTRTKKVAE